MSLRPVLAVLLLLALPAAAAPERSVTGHAVISRADPAVEIRLPKSAQYVGTDRFLLRDSKLGDFDACQLFAFAGAGGKLYWVQFEDYLPSHPELHHAYDSPRHASLGGLDFYVDSWITPGDSKPDPGSDSQRYYAVLAAHGIKRRDMMAVRFVHLADAAKRKELMIIYREPLPAGTSPASLAKGGKDYARWPSLRDGLITRGEASVTVMPSR